MHQLASSLRLAFNLAVALALALALAACGGGTSSDGGGDDMPPPDASMTGDGMTTTLDPAACTGFAANAVAASQTCGTPLPGNAQAQLDTMCRKGITAAALCGGDPAAGLACFETAEPSDWVCAGGGAYPACNGDLAAALGMYCLVALGNPSCASGIQCEFNSDCSAGMSCNGATGQCFSTSAYCIGLPCEFNADCPAGETCNNTEGACIGE